MMVTWAEHDTLVSRKSCQRFVDKINTAGGKAELFIIPKKNHMTALRDFGEPSDPVTKKVLAFIQLNLSKRN